MLRASLRGVARVAGARAPVNWPRLLFRYTDQKARDHLTALQANFAATQAAYASVPKSPEKIDWAHFKVTIKTPGVVDAYRAEYESEVAKQVKVNESELQTKLKAQAAEVTRLEKKALESKEKLDDLAYAVEELTWMRDNLDMVDSTLIDQFYPGMTEWQAERELEGNAFTHEAAYDKLDAVDLKELRKQLSEGNVRALAGIQFVEGTAPWLTYHGWMRHVKRQHTMDEEMKNPHLSTIYRAHQLKTLLGRV